MALRLVVGLGNPGPAYERTRHNVGFQLAQRLAKDAGSSWKEFRGLGLAARAEDLWLAKPTTYMNESGRFIRAFADFHKILPGEMLVVYDEIALPLGRLRLRLKGSSGGQNGMRSILEHFGTQEVPRLRIGIGPQPERVDATDFVLGRFSKAEESALGLVLDRAADAVRVAAGDGLEAAMNRFNPED